jgi:hypothetical protein
MRVTPSLNEHISNEINEMGFKIQKKRKSRIAFFVLNILAIAVLILLDLEIINFDNTVFDLFFKGILIVYLFISIFIPIVWRFSYDGLSVKLKDNYQVFLNPYYRIRKSKVKIYQLIGIYLKSNRIAFKFNKHKKAIFKKIVRKRWLPRKSKSFISKFGLSPFLRFIEFSTPSNIHKQFLNIVLAIQEWDITKKE